MDVASEAKPTAKYAYVTNTQLNLGVVKSVICCSPELLLTSRGQVTVDKTKGCTVEHEGHSHCSLVTYKTNVTLTTDGSLFK